MLLHHADFALQEQAEDNLMVAFSFTMAAKPIKSLQLHFSMIQFLIIQFNPFPSVNISSQTHSGEEVIRVP